MCVDLLELLIEIITCENQKIKVFVNNKITQKSDFTAFYRNNLVLTKNTRSILILFILFHVEQVY